MITKHTRRPQTVEALAWDGSDYVLAILRDKWKAEGLSRMGAKWLRYGHTIPEGLIFYRDAAGGDVRVADPDQFAERFEPLAGD